MQTIKLYKYTRTDGGTTVSPNEPECEYTIMYRLIADEGKVLTDGESTTICKDTEDVSKWSEVEDAETEDSGTEEATEEDYLEAFAELGVTDEESNA